MKTTKKDFETFKTECQKWVERFGLTEWNVTFRHRELKSGVAAHTQYDANASSACFSLAKTTDPSENTAYGTTVEDSAKHEVLHLLLAKLFWKGTARYCSFEELEEAEHGVIARLMKLL